MLSKTTRKWQGDFTELLMLVYTSAKLSNYFLGAVSSRFCATSKSGGAKVQVTGHRSGHRSGYRSQATGQVTGQVTGHRPQVKPQVTHKNNRTLDKTVLD